MAKKLVAVTNIKIGNSQDELFLAGTELNIQRFTKQQILDLHAAGAIEIQTVEEPQKEIPEETQEVKTPEVTQQVKTPEET